MQTLLDSGMKLEHKRGAHAATAGTRNLSQDRLQENVGKLAELGMPGALIAQILNDAAPDKGAIGSLIGPHEKADRMGGLIQADLQARRGGYGRIRGQNPRAHGASGGGLGSLRVDQKPADTRRMDERREREQYRDDLKWELALRQKMEQEKLSGIMKLLGGLPKQKTGYTTEIVDVAGAKLPRRKNYAEDIDYTSQLLALLR